MGGPGSIHHVPSNYSRPSDLDSKAANRTHKAQPEQRSTPSTWPESVGNDGAGGGFDAAALAHKAARFLGRLEAAANRETHGVEPRSSASRRPSTADSVAEGAGATARLVSAAGDVYAAAKPLVRIAKAGKAVPPKALILVAISMLPQLIASCKEIRDASRELKDAAANYKMPKETISVLQQRQMDSAYQAKR